MRLLKPVTPIPWLRSWLMKLMFEAPGSSTIQHVIFAMRGAVAYHAFETALAATAAGAASQRDIA